MAIEAVQKEERAIQLENGMQIGFFGMEKYEIMLYLSRIFKQLGKKVLLVDYSENGALSEGIPVWETFTSEWEMEMVAENEPYAAAVDYCGIHFLKDIALNRSIKKQYDCILIDFGFDVEHMAAEKCSKVVLVSDQQLHNIHRLRRPDVWDGLTVYAVLKELCPCRITPEYILDEMGIQVEPDRCFIIYQDAWDTKCRINCQYSKLSPFVRLSKEYRDFLKNFTKEIFPECSKTEIEKAFRSAEKGAST